MNIKTLGDLSKIADICRKKGIETIKITPDSVEFKLLEPALKPKRVKKAQDSTTESSSTLSNGPTDEELLFWSSGGIPESSTAGQG